MNSGHFLVLFAITAGMVSAAPAVFADHSEVTIEPLKDSWQLNTCGVKTGVECYVPGTATVDVGGKVIFSNTDFRPHTFSSGMPTDDKAGLVFNSGLLAARESHSWTPDAAGEYPYFCMIHPWMLGKIIVQEAGAEKDDEKEMKDGKDMMKDDDKDVTKDGMKEEPKTAEEKGGCLVATAAYGTELAPQIQQLREIRDNTLLQTASGAAFMGGFNQLYYSFSPAVADLEREHPVFKEAVRAFITPMMSSLSLLSYADIGSEQEMLGYGISLILLNIGMYVGIPAFGILKLYQFRRN